ncbi:MAG: hypothetical protein WCE79_20730 [Xanthobacteraceae bacterium]
MLRVRLKEAQEEARQDAARRESLARSIEQARRDLDEVKREIAEKRAAEARADEAARIRCDIAWERFVETYKRYAAQQKAGVDRKWDGQPRDRGRFDFGKKPKPELVSQPAAMRRPGHHYVPRQVYKDRRLSDDTRKVFEETTTGKLEDTRTNVFDSSHRAYNKAVNEQFDRFLAKNNITEEQMSPQQARELLGEIVTSGDPRIRNFNMRMWMREIFRGGRFRGNE